MSLSANIILCKTSFTCLAVVIFSVQCYSRLAGQQCGGGELGSVGDLWPGLWSQQLPPPRHSPAPLKYRDYVTANTTHRSRTRYMSRQQTIGNFLFDPVFLRQKVRVVKPTCKWRDVTSGSVSAIVWTACRQVWRWKLCQPSFIAGPSIRYGAVMVTLSAPPSVSCLHCLHLHCPPPCRPFIGATLTQPLLHTLSCALGTSQWHYAYIKMSLKVLKCLCLKISVGYRNRFYWNMNTDLINVWSNVTREFSFETTLQLFIYNFSWKIVDLILNEINSWSHLHFYILLGWRNCYKSSWS